MRNILDISQSTAKNFEVRQEKRYKTALKQVIGGLFASSSQSALEQEIVDLVINGSEKVDDPYDGPRGIARVWKEVLNPIMEKLKAVMRGRES